MILHNFYVFFLYIFFSAGSADSTSLGLKYVSDETSGCHKSRPKSSLICWLVSWNGMEFILCNEKKKKRLGWMTSREKRSRSIGSLQYLEEINFSRYQVPSNRNVYQTKCLVIIHLDKLVITTKNPFPKVKKIV